MTAATQPHADFFFLSTHLLVESPKNPRKHFDQAKLNELSASIREHGVLTPLLARQIPGDGTHPKYELAAGHRRFRAAQLAGVDELPVLIREMDDVQFLEVLTIENLQRDDVHPLEEAQGYDDLMKQASYTAARIGERIGKSEKYVYDRIKLLKLIPEAKKLFLADRITAGHAILLARLKKEDQERAIDPANASFNGSQRSGIWQNEHSLWNPADDKRKKKEDPYEDLKAVSVRELEAWIDAHVRVDLKHDADPMLFPEIAADVAQAREMKLKVIPITFEHAVSQDARAEERTYGRQSWHRADGREKSKPCEYSALGYVAAGPNRGDAFKVCVRRDKCEVHFPAEVKAARAREKAKKAASVAPSKKNEKAEQKSGAAAERELQQQIKEQAERDRYENAIGDLCDELGTHLKKQPAGATSKLADYLVKEIQDQFYGVDFRSTAKSFPRGKSAEDLVRFICMGLIVGRFEDLDREDMAGELKPFGFDLEKTLDRIAPAEEEEESAPKKPAAKKRS